MKRGVVQKHVFAQLQLLRNCPLRYRPFLLPIGVHDHIFEDLYDPVGEKRQVAVLAEMV